MVLAFFAASDGIVMENLVSTYRMFHHRPLQGAETTLQGVQQHGLLPTGRRGCVALALVRFRFFR